MVSDILLSVVGCGLLYFGADWLVKGASSLARSLGVSQVVIGLTVVAFGTSMPELVVSAISAFQHKSMIAVGNVVGSNICNITLILGLAAVFQPLVCHWSVIKRDIPIMVGVSVAAVALTLDGRLGRIDGAVLFMGIIAYTVFNYRTALKESDSTSSFEQPHDGPKPEDNTYVASRAKQVGLVLVGLAGVIVGAEIVIKAAVGIMHALGVSEKFVGLTVVAFGTSLPELATSVVAALRKEMDISIGNVVGSNVFNLLGVLGVSALITPISIPGGVIGSGLIVDYLVMLFTSALPWFFIRNTCTITSSHGAILIGCYVAYLAYLVIKV